MELYIQIKDGQPFEHPIVGDNFRQAFLHIDVHNLPPEFAKFERIEKPIIGVFQVYEGVTYEWFGDVVKDAHRIRVMTKEETAVKQVQLDAEFQLSEKFAAETKARFDAAIGSVPDVIG